MHALLKAAFSRYMHEYFTILTLIGSAVIGCLCALTTISYNTYFEINRIWFIVILLLCALLTAITVGREFADNTFRNKLIVGHSKYKVYLSELTAALLLSFASYVLSAGPIYLVTGEYRRDLPASGVAQMYMLLLCVYLFFTVLTVTADFLSGSRIAAVIAACAAMLIMYQLSNLQEDVIYRSSKEYEFETEYITTIDEDGNDIVLEIQNRRPDFLKLTETERNTVIFANHCNTFSSLQHFTMIYNEYSVCHGGNPEDRIQWLNERENLLKSLRYDVFAQCIIMMLLTAAGAVCFQRKDLK